MNVDRFAALDKVLCDQARLYAGIPRLVWLRDRRDEYLRLAKFSLSFKAARDYIERAKRMNRQLVIEKGKARARGVVPAKQRATEVA